MESCKASAPRRTSVREMLQLLEHFPQRFRAKPQSFTKLSAKESCTESLLEIHSIAENALSNCPNTKSINFGLIAL
jgi:hypothetical protein